MPPRPPRRLKRTPQRSGVHVHGSIPAVSGPLIVATDASGDDYGISGGYLATSGHYGFASHPYPPEVSGPDRVTVAELRAVELALQAVDPNASQAVRVLCDSTNALAWLQRWRDGDSALPTGYRPLRALAPSALSRLQLYAEHMPNVEFHHVKGHAGDPLNEAADALARLGLRASGGVVSRTRAGELARVWAWHHMDLYTEARKKRARAAEQND